MSREGVHKTLERSCANCGVDLDVTLYKDGTYDGGHFFDVAFDEYGELWECGDCFDEASAGGEADE